MRLVDFDYFGPRETHTLVIALGATLLTLALLRWIVREKGERGKNTGLVRKSKRTKSTMPKKNSKQKKQTQKEADKKKVNKAVKAEASVPSVVQEQNTVDDAKMEPDKIIENGSDESDSEDDRCFFGEG